MRFVSLLAVVSPLALGLSACGSPDPIPATDQTPEASASLGPIQKANFERLNRDEVRKNYAAIVAGPDKAEPMPEQANMDFATLDRDGNKKLSVAEFMVWTMGPSAGTTAPTDDQINAAASKFFANDVDGDSMLTPEEFAAASGQPAPMPSAGASEATDSAQ